MTVSATVFKSIPNIIDNCFGGLAVSCGYCDEDGIDKGEVKLYFATFQEEQSTSPNRRPNAFTTAIMLQEGNTVDGPLQEGGCLTTSDTQYSIVGVKALGVSDSAPDKVDPLMWELRLVAS